MPRLFIKKILFLGYSLLMIIPINAQNNEMIIDFGINEYKQGNYTKAHQLFENAIEIDSSKMKLQYYYGINLIKMHQYGKSCYFLKKVVNKDPSGKIYPEASYYLGTILKQLKNYPEALLEFKKSKAHFIHEKNNFFYHKSSREINSTIFAMRHNEQINEEMVISPLPKPINGYNAEFAGFEDEGKLYFTSVKDSLHAQIFLRKNDKIEKISPQIDDKRFHNANGLFYKNHQYFLFTRCDSIGHCKIMISKKENENWSLAKELSNELNINSHNVTQPFITKLNGNNILFFASDRKGGYGNLDIWYAEILDDLSIANIKNAGPNVNSPENEITPFYHNPSNRLYFSSTWHNGFGGYDISYSHWNDSIFEIAHNAEQPINSSWNDMYFWINEYGKHGYVTSNRDGSLYEYNPHCCPDIWEFKTKSSIAEKEEFLSELDTKQIFKHKTGLTLPLALYFHNDEPMPKSRDTVVLETYPETIIKYLELKPTYLKSFSEGNSIEEKKIAYEQINYFFEKYVTHGLNKLEKFKSQLIPLLKEHSSIEITIRGFSSPLAKNDYNTNLSKRRISSIINYFEKVDNGELQKYIDEGKLIIKAAPFGEKKSSTKASDDVENTKQSIYSPKAAIERRIEIQEVIFND